jgi:hypothetical protein
MLNVRIVSMASFSTVGEETLMNRFLNNGMSGRIPLFRLFYSDFSTALQDPRGYPPGLFFAIGGGPVMAGTELGYAIAIHLGLCPLFSQTHFNQKHGSAKALDGVRRLLGLETTIG